MALILGMTIAAIALTAVESSWTEKSASDRSLPVQPLSVLGADMQQMLSEALGVGFRVHGGRMLDARASLEPLWRTMAKDANGRTDHRSLRYMVQRHFLQKYNISIIGMESPQVNSTSSAAEPKSLAELTPNFVRSMLQGVSSEAGFSLEDTVVLVAVIDHLIDDSGHELLEDSYFAAGYKITDLLTRSQFGALDESSVIQRPQVSAANYTQSTNSCAFGQMHSRVRCANPCLDFNSDIKAAIGAPPGAPEKISAITSNFAHGQDDEPPMITRKLKAQLHENTAIVAETKEKVRHGKDTVPTHGDSPAAMNMSDEHMGMSSIEEELLSEHANEKLAANSPLRSIVRAVLSCLAILTVFVIVVLQPAMEAVGIARETGYLAENLITSLPATDNSRETKEHHFI